MYRIHLPLDWNPAVGSYEQGNEISGSVKCRKCVGWLSSLSFRGTLLQSVCLRTQPHLSGHRGKNMHT
jgi:hypothetical protein